MEAGILGERNDDNLLLSSVEKVSSRTVAFAEHRRDTSIGCLASPKKSIAFPLSRTRKKIKAVCHYVVDHLYIQKSVTKANAISPTRLKQQTVRRGHDVNRRAWRRLGQLLPCRIVNVLRREGVRQRPITITPHELRSGVQRFQDLMR